MDFIENVSWFKTSLETDSSESFAFLKHLCAHLDQIQWLCGSMGDESHSISGKESLSVHSLVPVAPVLDFHLSGHVCLFCFL